MSIRRRLMLQVGKSDPYDAMGYIKRGKVFHLDGINKGETEGAWTDLVGGIVFVNHGATENEDNWRFTGNKEVYLSYSGNMPTNINQTVEVCFLNNNTGCSMFINTITTGKPMFYILSSVVLFMQQKNTYPITLGTGNKHTVSLNLDIGCHNGVSVEKTGTTSYYTSNGNVTYIGKRSHLNGNPFSGYIYSIRLYNRMLTLAEMLHNQQVDNERFNLGLDI